jgi:amino acid transporter
MASVNEGISAFQRLLKDVRTLSGWSAKGALAAPLADFVLGVGPPWPVAVPVLTSCVEVIALIFVFTLLGAGGRAAFRRSLRVFAVVLVLSFAAYLTLLSLYVHHAPNGERLVAGFIVRPDVVPMLAEDYTASDALREAGWVAERIWTPTSITLSRLSLLASWVMSFSAFVGLLGVFALQEWSKKPKKTG